VSVQGKWEEKAEKRIIEVIYFYKVITNMLYNGR